MVPLVNSALGRLRPKDHEFQVSLGYLQDPVTKQNERLYSSGWVWADVSSLLVHNVLQETLKHHTVLSITSNRVESRYPEEAQVSTQTLHQYIKD